MSPMGCMMGSSCVGFALGNLEAWSNNMHTELWFVLSVGLTISQIKACFN